MALRYLHAHLHIEIFRRKQPEASFAKAILPGWYSINRPNAVRQILVLG